LFVDLQYEIERNVELIYFYLYVIEEDLKFLQLVLLFEEEDQVDHTNTREKKN
jgi:hypothetical protein